MKKHLLAIGLFLCSTLFIFAQDKSSKTSESDVYYGASKGDFSISFGLLPVINYVGNMFNGTTSQKFPGLGGISNSFYEGTTLSGKYFLSKRTSINAGLGVDCLKDKNYSYSSDNHSVAKKETVTGTNRFIITLGSQFYFRPGKRIQPIVGANIMYAFANRNYKKEVDVENDTKTKDKSPSHTIGIVADCGVELFVTKSVSFKLAANLGLSRTINKDIYKSGEDDDYSRVSSNQTRFATGVAGADIALNFYF